METINTPHEYVSNPYGKECARCGMKPGEMSLDMYHTDHCGICREFDEVENITLLSGHGYAITACKDCIAADEPFTFMSNNMPFGSPMMAICPSFLIATSKEDTMNQAIKSFSGQHRIFSNFEGPGFWYRDVWYPTNEHFFQAMKSTSLAHRKRASLALTPGIAKWMGSKKGMAKFGVVVREDWETIKDEVMLYGLRKKFAQSPANEALLMTGDATLVEGNYWGDTYWGVCNGIGENKLGILLMQVREELRKELS